jgi:hypothetical protein
MTGESADVVLPIMAPPVPGYTGRPPRIAAGTAWNPEDADPGLPRVTIRRAACAPLIRRANPRSERVIIGPGPIRGSGPAAFIPIPLPVRNGTSGCGGPPAGRVRRMSDLLRRAKPRSAVPFHVRSSRLRNPRMRKRTECVSILFLILYHTRPYADVALIF